MTTIPAAAGGAKTNRAGLDHDLAPVAGALAAQAARLADRILADADARANVVLDEAGRQGEELIESARTDGAATARRLASSVVADARLAARQEVLGAQRSVYEDVREQAQARVKDLVDSPQAAALTARLGQHARERLGDDAEMEASAQEPGIVVRSGRRRLDLSVGALLERELPSMGDEIAELWS